MRANAIKAVSRIVATGAKAFENELRSILTLFTPDFEIFPATANARKTPASAKLFQVPYDVRSLWG